MSFQIIIKSNNTLQIPLNDFFSLKSKEKSNNFTKCLKNCGALIEQILNSFEDKDRFQHFKIHIHPIQESYFGDHSEEIKVLKKEKLIKFGIKSLDKSHFLETDLQKTYFILNHEIGHLFFHEFEKDLKSHFLQIPFYQKLPSQVQKVILEFQEEIFADLFSTIIHMKTIAFEFDYFENSKEKEDRKYQKIESMLKHLIEFREISILNKLDKNLNESWHDIIGDFRHYTNPAVQFFNQMFKDQILPHSFSTLYEINSFCIEMSDYFSTELVHKLENFDKNFHQSLYQTNEQVILGLLKMMNQIDYVRHQEPEHTLLRGVYSHP